MFMSRVNELLRRYWAAARAVLLLIILYMGYVPNSPSKVEWLIVLLSLMSIALFIWGIFKRARVKEP